MNYGFFSWLIGALAFLLGALAWISIGPSTVNRGNVASVTLRGRGRVRLLRMVAPIFAGISRSIGLNKVPVRVTRHKVMTDFGVARVTLLRPIEHEEESLPAHFNFHGGGFVAGASIQDDVICRHIAVHARCIVVNVEYALAPKYPFPTAILQSYQVIEKLLANADKFQIDRGGLTLGGFSAGAGIVASVVQLSKKRNGFKSKLQVLAYPVLDFSWSGRRPSEDKSYGSALSPWMMDFFRNLYLPKDDDRRTSLASPLLADEFDGLPAALILVGENDLLRDDARRYSECLERAGGDVRYREFPGCDHGFTHSGPKQSARDALDLMTYAIRLSLSEDSVGSVVVGTIR